MVNSSRAAAAHSWAACGRPGDTWRGELARHASQNEKLESSSIDRNAAGPRLPRRTGGIAQLVERRLCKPNVAGPSPTASTSRRFAANAECTMLNAEWAPAAPVRPLIIQHSSFSIEHGRVAQLVRASH